MPSRSAIAVSPRVKGLVRAGAQRQHGRLTRGRRSPGCINRSTSPRRNRPVKEHATNTPTPKCRTAAAWSVSGQQGGYFFFEQPFPLDRGLTVSLTVVLGLVFALDFGTNCPVTALRTRLAMGILSARFSEHCGLQ